MKGISAYNTDFFKVKTGNDLLKESITRILFTTPGERVMNAEFGCKLKHFIFEPESVLKQDVEDEIRKAINRWEPRVTIISLDAEMKDDREATITLYLRNKDTYIDFDYDVLVRY